ncbi:hypothetical protein NSTC731_00506 [Nostoc sp. DSM 114167]
MCFAHSLLIYANCSTCSIPKWSKWLPFGFQPAYKYEEVHELIFESGYLMQSINRSEEMAEIRQKIIPESKFYDQWHLTWRGKDGS